MPHYRVRTREKGWSQDHSFGDIHVSISERVKGTGMPAFGALSPVDGVALARCAESFGKFDHHDRATEAIASLDARYHLSEGPHTPNETTQGPVEKGWSGP